MTCKGCTAHGEYTCTHARIHRAEAPPLSSAISLSAEQKNGAVFFGSCSNFITDSIQSFLVHHKVNTMNADPPPQPPPPPPHLLQFFFSSACKPPAVGRAEPSRAGGNETQRRSFVFQTFRFALCFWLTNNACLQLKGKRIRPELRLANTAHVGSSAGNRSRTAFNLSVFVLLL